MKQIIYLEGLSKAGKTSWARRAQMAGYDFDLVHLHDTRPDLKERFLDVLNNYEYSKMCRLIYDYIAAHYDLLLSLTARYRKNEKTLVLDRTALSTLSITVGITHYNESKQRSLNALNEDILQINRESSNVIYSYFDLIERMNKEWKQALFYFDGSFCERCMISDYVPFALSLYSLYTQSSPPRGALHFPTEIFKIDASQSMDFVDLYLESVLNYHFPGMKK